MTKEEIVKALRVCSAGGDCIKCSLLGECGCVDAMMDAAADLIETQAAEIGLLKAKVPRWIPVRRLTPPDQEEVLVLTRSKNGVRNVDKGYWAIDHFIHRGRSAVTHWMLLPELPKEEDEM